jgi:RNA polymerase sigma-70 factor (ECF subfamily)
MSLAGTWTMAAMAAVRRPQPPSALSMSEEAFRAFYESTAQPLRAYLARTCGHPQLADDLLQESYLRLLRSALPPDAESAHRRNYLYRIATNLVHDHFRKQDREVELSTDVPSPARITADTERDVQRALNCLEPRDRSLLWLAYVEQSSHREIASATGLKESSIRPMLYRARQRMLAFLHPKGDRA